MKTTVNVNEISSNHLSPDMDKAMKEIQELKNKLREYEEKMMKQSTTIINIQESKEQSLMIVDSLNNSSSNIQNQ